MRTNITWEAFSDYFQSDMKLSLKTRSWFHKAIGWFLLITGINKSYMTEFVTVIYKDMAVPTLAMYDSIMNPEGMSIDDLQLCLHEYRHRQQAGSNYLLFASRYLLSQKARAAYELDAYKLTMLTYVIAGQDSIAEQYITYVPELLKAGYGIKEEHVKNFSQKLQLWYQDCKLSVYPNTYLPFVEFLQNELD